MKIKRIIPAFLAFILLFCSIPVYAYSESEESGVINYINSTNGWYYTNAWYQFDATTTRYFYGNNSSNIKDNYFLVCKDNRYYIFNARYNATYRAYSNDSLYFVYIFAGSYRTYYTSTTNTIYLITESVALNSGLPIYDILDSTDVSTARTRIIAYFNGGSLSNIELRPDLPDEFDGTNGVNYLGLDPNTIPSWLKNLFDFFAIDGNTQENTLTGDQQVSLGISSFLNGPNYIGDPDLSFQYMIGDHNIGDDLENSYNVVTGFLASNPVTGPLSGPFALFDLFLSNTLFKVLKTDGTEETYTYQDTGLDPDQPKDIYVRPVYHDIDNNRYITGNWTNYTNIGSTVVNRYSTTTENNITYTTNVQQQTQYNFNYDVPLGPSAVTDFPIQNGQPVPGSGATVTNIYNYYTTYESETNNFDNSITNNYWSYPSTLDTNTPELDELLTELTPENFFSFLKKFLNSLLKFFTMIINFLELFIPAWVVVILKIAVTSALLLAIGLIIVKGVL